MRVQEAIEIIVHYIWHESLEIAVFRKREMWKRKISGMLRSLELKVCPDGGRSGRLRIHNYVNMLNSHFFMVLREFK